MENRDRINIPLIALRGMTVLPGMIVHFDVSRKKSIIALERAMTEGQKVFLVTQRNPEDMEPSIGQLYSVGVIAKVGQIIKLPNSFVRVLVTVEDRAELIRMEEEDKYLRAEVIVSKPETCEDPVTCQAMARVLKGLISKYADANKKFSRELVQSILSDNELPHMLMFIANHMPLYYEQKQQILECETIEYQYEYLTAFLANEINIEYIKSDYQAKVKEKVDKNQKEYILREQMKVIRQELGDEDSATEADDYKARADRLKAPKEVKDRLDKEIKRFRTIPSNSSENTVVRTYIETLLDLPWNKASKDRNDISEARKILDEDHYGLDKVKDRVTEFLAVRQFTKGKGDSPIICLVGPPGTGKTSIAKSLARALNKKYVRICLGGVRDEAEIRGHRKTYVGAMPGRIANGMKEAGVRNPLMLLDEIDKLGNDYKGDPASALLEVLDSEQNVKFRDHYIEVPMDLSQVLFVATANTTETIPAPLLDRMEIIELNSYTVEEKRHIAKDHLICKQRAKHGLNEKQFSINEKALIKMIEGYTREAGVRNLERKIAGLCRKAVKEMIETGKKSVKITEGNVAEYLGTPKYSQDKINESDEVGIVRGLAWTAVGGDTLEIEVNIMPGKGEVSLTGKLGDVMKESAMAGLSYIRSVAGEYQIDPVFFKENDIHLHIPEGAVPKDGPSAGITMATGILSAITGIPVRRDVAMTGEITLRGRVLPVGGLKEKLLAAKMAGIKMVLVPAKNRPDIEEISEDITRGIKIIYIENMQEVLKKALRR